MIPIVGPQVPQVAAKERESTPKGGDRRLNAKSAHPQYVVGSQVPQVAAKEEGIDLQVMPDD